MISYLEALQLIDEHTHVSSAMKLKLTDAFDFVTSCNIYAPIDTPPFDQSAMDGYALNLENTDLKGRIKLQEETFAGDTNYKTLEPGKTIRIYTGAPMPAGANAVIIQENVTREENEISVREHTMTAGMNIRKAGSQTQKGNLAVAANHRLNAGSIGFLAGMGVDEVEVIAKPRIGIIVTGKELIKSRTPLQHGQIYESNLIMLEAALKQTGITCVYTAHATDEIDDIENKTKEALSCADMVLFTGGVSVGDYDLVIPVLKNLNTNQIFHKIKQKPGKPLFYGKNGDKQIFGLPGNPASVLTCFYEYVIPCIRKMSGLSFSPPYSFQFPLASDYNRKAGLTGFLKVRISESKVWVDPNQESYKLNAFPQSNGLWVIDEETSEVKAGEMVTVHLTDYCWI